MDKLKMQTANKADENYKKLAEMFPNAVTETITGYDENGKAIVERAIDKDVLMQEISCKVVDGNEERYQFTWPDKKKSVLLANAPINKTLRPVRDDETTPTGADSEGKPYCSSGSVNFDNTENLYIEGDNLEVLKLLQETYLGKVDIIFIDPPYNTGGDFVYGDNFTQRMDEYMANSGQYDDEGNRLTVNPESSGRFHTDWLNMIYPRLKIAKDLLTDDGLIFITLDDHENTTVRMICNEIFGASNFITEFIWEKKKKPSFLHRNVGKLFDYVLCYAKNAEMTTAFSVEKTTEGKKYPFNNAGNGRATLVFPPHSIRFTCPDGVIQPQDMSEGNIVTILKKELHIVNHTNENELVLEGEWRYSQQKLNEIVKAGEEIVISKIPFRPNHVKSGGEIKKMKNILSPTHYGCETNEDATSQVSKLFDGDQTIFDTPKPVGLLKLLISGVSYHKDELTVLDFFSGSATTAHAVMQLNAEDGGHRKFIMVQLPEVTDEKREAYKAGYKNICEIGKERIRRAAKKIAEENPEANFDGGFRVLKCDSSNMKDVYYNPAEYEQSLFSRLEDNIKEDRTPEDLLFQVMLDLGILLSSKIQVRSEKVGMRSYSYFDVEDGYLIACFDKDIDEEVITAIAKQKPYYFVMRDSSMANDSVATNFEQIFATYSPDTVRKVL